MGMRAFSPPNTPPCHSCVSISRVNKPPPFFVHCLRYNTAAAATFKTFTQQEELKELQNTAAAKAKAANAAGSEQRKIG